MAKLELRRVAEAKEGIRREALKQINRILRPTFDDVIRPEVKKLFLKAMSRNDIIRGIQGYFPEDEEKDIQAIFGLSDEDAEEAIQEMIRIVESSLQTEFKVFYPEGKTQIRYTFRFFWEDLEKNIREMESATYRYEYKETVFGRGGGQYSYPYTVFWINWLLDGVSVDAELTFDDNSKGLALAKTRSGRARMLRSSTDYWSWPGTNFIEDIVYSPYFREKLNVLYTKLLEKEILDGIRRL